VDLEKVAGEITEVLVTAEQIDKRIAELAAEIDTKYAGKDLLLVGVLKGSNGLDGRFVLWLRNPVFWRGSHS
jgi:hypoxanthine-guanine phosphoribosyltransferase